VGCKGEPYPGDPAPTKGMKRILKDSSRVDAIAVKTANVFNTGQP
jgi:hypothetical protein